MGSVAKRISVKILKTRKIVRKVDRERHYEFLLLFIRPISLKVLLLKQLACPVPIGGGRKLESHAA